MVKKASSSNYHRSKLFRELIGMGFPDKLVVKAVEENGEEKLEAIVETLLTLSALEDTSEAVETAQAVRTSGPILQSSPETPGNSPQESDQIGSDVWSSDCDKDRQDERSYSNILCAEVEENAECLSDKEKILRTLASMGFSVEEASLAMERCGPDASIIELTDFISAIQVSRALDAFAPEEEKENAECLSDKEKTLRTLASMGYSVEEASLAMERCGPDASVLELTDFIYAAQVSRAPDAFYPEEEKPRRNLLCKTGRHKKRKLLDRELKKKKLGGLQESEIVHLTRPMIGFGVPTEPRLHFGRKLPEPAIGPPYFYYENVALTPKGVWDTIKGFLYHVEPEFVDSKYFCAAARKRGYIHNLPIQNRFPILPLPPSTIQDALPSTTKWWPVWDTRTKLNCLQTSIGSAKLTERILEALEGCEDVPPPEVKKYVLDECRKWNLVWVGRNKVAPLECDEVEMLLGFPKNHSRGGGITMTDRYKSLGNSFQVDTVAYHLSVLKDLFPKGLNVLSLFSGIGGAEVALYRLGIPMKTVVSVEKSKANRDIVRNFWRQTNQTGALIEFDDIQQLKGDNLEQISNSIGGFDLVIGGSPCNNLAGSNRHHRDGLEGAESSLFYDYFRILDLVKGIMGKKQ